MSKLKTNTIRHVDGSNDNITLDSSQNVTVEGDLTVPDKLIHSGDTNTSIRFPAADTVSVETGGSERLRIDSSGNVGIGTTPSAWGSSASNTVIQPKNGVIWDYAGQQFDVGHNYYFDDTDYHFIRDGYAARQTFHNNTGDIAFWSGGTGSADGSITWAEKCRVKANGNVEVSDGDLVIGTAGHGIDFSANSDGPGTSVSELFHIYEEGYWEPTWGANFSLDSNYATFQYTRVGRLVTVRGVVVPGSWSGTDEISMSLPFASLNDHQHSNAGACGTMFRYLDGCSGGLASYIGDNSSSMYFYKCESGNANYTALTNADLNTSCNIHFMHTYSAA